MYELETGLKQAIAEAVAAEQSEAFWGAAIVAAKFTKASCDVIIDVMAEWVPNKVAATVIKEGYHKADKVAGIIGDASAGKFDAYKVGRVVVSLGADKLTSSGKISGQAKTAVAEISKRSDIVRDALTNKLDSKKIGKYIADQHLDITEIAAKEIYGTKGGQVVSTAKSILQYSYEIYEILDNRKEESKHGSGISSAKKTCLLALKKIEWQIRQIQHDLDECEDSVVKINLGLYKKDPQRSESG